jgi:hypothetical protein
MLLPLLFAGCAATQSIAPRDPLNVEVMSTPEVITAFARLVQLAGYGWWSQERGAFLVRSNDNTLHLIVWPPTCAFHTEVWRGVFPAGTIAIVHTHPARDPEPSFQDEKEAQRIGLPSFVLTPALVVAVSPRNGTTEILARRGWLAQK